MTTSKYHLTKGYGTAASPYGFPGAIPLNLSAVGGGGPALAITPLKVGTLVIQNDEAATSDMAGTTPIYETLDILAGMVGQPIEGKFRAISNTSTANAFIVQW